MRIITGRVKSIPVQAMRIITKHFSVPLKLEEQAVLWYEKLVRLPETKWTQEKNPIGKNPLLQHL